jgi:hypothetical protein
MATHRKLLLGIGIVLLALVVFAGVRIVQRLTAKPNIAIDYSAKAREHAEASARARGLSPDRALDARFEAVVQRPMAHAQAFVQAMADKDARFASEARRNPPVDYTLLNKAEAHGASVSDVQVELANLAYADAIATGQLDKLLELRELRGALREWKPGEAIMLQLVPLTTPGRFAARLLGVRLREQLAAHDGAGATQTVDALLSLGAAFSGQGSMVESLVHWRSEYRSRPRVLRSKLNA